MPFNEKMFNAKTSDSPQAFDDTHFKLPETLPLDAFAHIHYPWTKKSQTFRSAFTFYMIEQNS